MFKNKLKIETILNSNLLLFTVLCLCGVLYIGFIINYYYLLLLVLLPLTIRRVQMNRWQLIILSIVVLVFIFLLIFTSSFSLFATINAGLDKCNGHVVRNEILAFFDRSYDKETAAFIKLILFNIKSNESHIIVKEAVDLGIVWLICVSGFHISLITRIIKRIFKKKPQLCKYINICLVGFYSYLLRFSYASIRILFNLIFSKTLKRFQIENFEKLGFVGILIFLFNPSCFASYSFLLSFIICAGACFINSLNLNNKLINRFLINIFAFAITIPFVVQMNSKISLLTFINTFIFTYISSFVFIYFLIFSWMPFMALIHGWIIIATSVLMGNISFSNIYVYCGQWEPWINVVYYLVLATLSKLLYLIVYNNKI